MIHLCCIIWHSSMELQHLLSLLDSMFPLCGKERLEEARERGGGRERGRGRERERKRERERERERD